MEVENVILLDYLELVLWSFGLEEGSQTSGG